MIRRQSLFPASVGHSSSLLIPVREGVLMVYPFIAWFASQVADCVSDPHHLTSLTLDVTIQAVRLLPCPLNSQ